MTADYSSFNPLTAKNSYISIRFPDESIGTEVPGVTRFNMSSGSANVFEGVSLRQDGFIRVGGVPPGSLDFEAHLMPTLPVWKRLFEAHENGGNFFIEARFPRIFWTGLADPSGVAIADTTGVVSFTPAKFPIERQPYGIGTVIEIGNDDYLITAIDLTSGNAIPTAYPVPQASIAKSDCNLVTPGMKMAETAANIIDYNDALSVDGSAIKAANLRLHGQPSEWVIDRTIT